MPALHFRFSVNRSFLGYQGHPITIPKEAIDYSRLEAEQLHEGGFVVIFPKGERLAAKMYYGMAGYGPYYQLHFTGDHREVPGYLEEGCQVYVLLTRLDGTNSAILEHVGR